MTKRIFRAVCITSLTVFVVTMMLVLGVLYEYFSTVQQNQLKTETYIIAQSIEQLGIDFFQDLDTKEYRITWVDSDGTVLYDNVYDTNAMENHMQRTEIKEAFSIGVGESSRYSDTLMQRSLYCARRLSDGTVIRLSISHGSVLMLLIGMFQPILIILVVATIMSFVLANKLSKRIVEPMNGLNLDEPLENEGYDELAPLLHRISSQQHQLKTQKAALQQRKNELDTIVGSMQEGMILLDKKGLIITINQSAKQLLNAFYAGVGDQILTVCRNPELQNAINLAEQGQRTDICAELQGKIIQISAAPVGYEDSVSAVAIVFFDITEQEKAEQQRREFTANVSHELKTPLHSISGYSELMKCGIVKPEDIPQFAEKIYSETHRLISLVEDIISLSHLDEGGKDLRWTDVELFSSAESVIQSLAGLAEESGIELHLEGCESHIHGVPELIHGILYNLCDNAIKYNRPNGSVTITVENRSITVKDTGIGIPKEHLDRIFERFYRVDKSHSKEVGGTGLGLSIVKHAAMIHKAKTAVNSIVGEGTSITITFPEK